MQARMEVCLYSATPSDNELCKRISELHRLIKIFFFQISHLQRFLSLSVPLMCGVCTLSAVVEGTLYPWSSQYTSEGSRTPLLASCQATPSRPRSRTSTMSSLLRRPQVVDASSPSSPLVQTQVNNNEKGARVENNHIFNFPPPRWGNLFSSGINHPYVWKIVLCSTGHLLLGFMVYSSL